MLPTDCIFCKVAAKDLPSDTLYEDDEVVIFRDIHPKAPTHLLIIPKQHIESILTIDDSTAQVPSTLVWKAKHFAAQQGIPGYKLTFHVGKEGGQIIDHLHLHLLAETKI